MFQSTKIQTSNGEFFLFSWKNLNFKHSLDIEISLEEEANKKFKDLDI